MTINTAMMKTMTMMTMAKMVPMPAMTMKLK